jgi:streptomycin 6-kinase
MDLIPQNFSQTIGELYGAAGMEWLMRLPGLLDDCARRWALTLSKPFDPLSYNYVAPAIRKDSTLVVLKVGFPNPELTSEIAALRLFEGRGTVRLLESDLDQGALLLERLAPGLPLLSLKDDQQATSIACQVMRKIWRPAPTGEGFPAVSRWAKGLDRYRQRFDGSGGPLPARLVDQAEVLFTELLTSMAEPVVLHGDLHHANILSAQRQPWLAIDPKGVIGEPAYETGALLLNPPELLAEPGAGCILARRLHQLAEELSFDRKRLRAWAIAQAVLSAWWSLEDHGHGWESGIAFAELLSAIKC